MEHFTFHASCSVDNFSLPSSIFSRNESSMEAPECFLFLILDICCIETFSRMLFYIWGLLYCFRILLITKTYGITKVDGVEYTNVNVWRCFMNPFMLSLNVVAPFFHVLNFHFLCLLEMWNVHFQRGFTHQNGLQLTIYRITCFSSPIIHINYVISIQVTRNVNCT